MPAPKTHTTIVAVLLVAIAWLVATLPALGGEGFSRFVSEDGAIALPEDFRTEFAHLGSWYVPEGDASGFHDVYTQRSTITAYRETGRFPDGAVLVKEIRASSVGDYTTGKGVRYANDGLKQWFVMVKDGTGRFPDHPLWGQGWGWALFLPDAPAKNVASGPGDCLGCHAPAQANDWVYVEAYPALAR